jgi:hypothetical protein
MALDDNAIPDDEVAAAFHKNRPPFSGFMTRYYLEWVTDPDAFLTKMAADIDKTTDDGI